MSGVGIILNALAVPTMVNIGGMAMPTENLAYVVQDIATSIARRETIPEAVIRVAPDAMPILFTAANVAIPYAGVAVLGVSLMIKYSKPPTPADQQRMWDQAQGIH